MTTLQSNMADVRQWAIAICMVLTICALAPTRDATASPDMRLWSFGDCERRYPHSDAEDYKECMRVVGSAEAKDLRARRTCEDSYANDPAGIDRCSSAYRATKEGRMPGSVFPDAAATAATTLTPEMALNVKAIASAGVEESSAATRETGPAEVATVRERSSVASLVLVGLLGVLLLGVGGIFVLRRQV